MDVDHRYEILLEPHAPHRPIQSPIWDKHSCAAEQYPYGQRMYVLHFDLASEFLG